MSENLSTASANGTTAATVAAPASPTNTSPTTATVTSPALISSPSPDAAEKAMDEASEVLMLQKLAADANEDVALMAQAISNYKAHGIIGLVPLISRAGKDAATTKADMVAAGPAIRSGVRTSEFWFAVVAVAAPSVGAAIGHPLPDGATWGGIGLAGLYATVRSLVKVLGY